MNLPSRDDINRALINVISEATNHPDPRAVLGKDTSKLRAKCVDAVMRVLNEIDFAPVRGRCPMGCGETLEINRHGAVSCSFGMCPDPHAAQTILDHNEPFHIVRIDESGWTCKHPLMERVEDKLFDCAVGKGLALLPPDHHFAVGTYEVHVNDDGSWQWRLLEGAS